MPRITFIIKNKKNEGLIVNSKEILTLYFYGINIQNTQGTTLSPSVIEMNIRKAQQEVEKYLEIRFFRQKFVETSDYFRNEFNRTGFVKTKLPVSKPLTFEGYIGETKQLEYPITWVVASQNGGNGTHKQVALVPNGSAGQLAITGAVFGRTILPSLGLVNQGQIPTYWHLSYITGFYCDQLPYDLLDIVGKLASIGLFNILGDIALGTAAVASYSLSIDGLSQSVNTSNSATNAAFGARIINYQKEIKESLKKAKGVYKGITFSSI